MTKLINKLENSRKRDRSVFCLGASVSARWRRAKLYTRPRPDSGDEVIETKKDLAVRFSLHGGEAIAAAYTDTTLSEQAETL